MNNIHQCSNCKITFNSKRDPKKTLSGNYFCSKSCSASFNNRGIRRNFQKHTTVICDDETKVATTTIKEKTKLCLVCENDVSKQKCFGKDKNVCNTCFRTSSYSAKIKQKTIGEYRQIIINKKQHPSWLSSAIRNFARSWSKHLPKTCQCCKYDLHVEVCHIKPISSFTDETLLGEVNDPSNILILCPNCHWELDNGFISADKFVHSERLELPKISPSAS